MKQLIIILLLLIPFTAFSQTKKFLNLQRGDCFTETGNFYISGDTLYHVNSFDGASQFVSLIPYINTDDQQLTISNDTIYLEDGGYVVLPPDQQGVTSIATNNGITGGTITSTGTVGLTGQALALHQMATNGFFYRNGTTIGARTITAGTGISVSNGNGASGNPTITNTAPNVDQNLSKAGTNNVDLNISNGSGITDALVPTGGSSGHVLTKGSGSAYNWEAPSGGLTGGAANKVTYWTGATTVSQNTNFHWDNTNVRLGIGTASPTAQLHVAGVGQFGQVSVGTASPVSNLYNWQGSSGNSTTGMWTSSTNGDARIWVDASGRANFSQVATTNRGITVGTDGQYIGLGKSTPGRTLDVGGDARIDNLTPTATTTNIVGSSSDGTLRNIGIGSGLSLSGNSLSTTGGLSGGAANKVAYWTGATSLSQNTNFHWDNTNVRLGVGTASPGAVFHVNGPSAGNIENGFRLSATGSSNEYNIYHTATWSLLHTFGGATFFTMNIGSPNSLTINPNVRAQGTVEVGNLTTGTATKLTGSDATFGQLRDVSIGTGLSLTSNTLTATTGLSGGAANKVAFWTGATSLSQNTNFHWDNTNVRLGIGNSSPQAKLDIKSNVNSSAGGIRMVSESSGGTLDIFHNTEGEARFQAHGNYFGMRNGLIQFNHGVIETNVIKQLANSHIVIGKSSSAIASCSSSGDEGAIYFDTTTKKFRGCTGTGGWVDLH